VVIYVDIINPGSTRAGLQNAGGGGSKSATVERIEYKLLSLTYKVLTTCEVTTTKPSYMHNLIRHGSRILQGRVSNPSERGTGGRAPKVEHFPDISQLNLPHR